MNLSLNDTIALISVFLPLLIPVGQVLGQYLVQRLPQAQQRALKEIGATVVAGIEQQARSGQITPDQRKDQAVAAMTELAKVAHINVNPTVISLLIEAAVDEYKQFNQQPTPVPADVPVPGV